MMRWDQTQADSPPPKGHVLTEDIRRLIQERPRLAGIGVAGMSNGSPGMEGYGPDEHYQTMQFNATGKIGVYSAH